jgi:UrcA family protein
MTVQYADLNLSSQSDAQLLYKRLRKASKSVCRDLESRDLSKKQLRDQCYEQALTGAVARVNHAALSALHAADGSIKLVQRRSASEPRS